MVLELVSDNDVALVLSTLESIEALALENIINLCLEKSSSLAPWKAVALSTTSPTNNSLI
jgi:hypothetical protein